MSLPSVYLYIDGVAMPTPAPHDINEFDLNTAATGRTENGELSRERIQKNLTEIDLSWPELSVADAIKIRDALQPASFVVKIWFLGEYIEMEMYAGDRQWTTRNVKDEEKYSLKCKVASYAGRD